MGYCMVPGCLTGGRTKNKNVILHALPKDPTRASLWIQASKRDNPPKSKVLFICSNHFLAEDYERDLPFELLNPGADLDANPKRRLKPTAVPSQQIPKKVCVESKRGAYAAKKELAATVREALTGSPTVGAECPEPEPSCATPNPAETEKLQLQLKIAELEKIIQQKTDEVDKKNKKIASYLSKLQGLFTDQQIDYLLHGTRPCPWNEETVIKALEMRTHLSRTQYDYLRDIGYPLPSLSTLQSWLKGFIVKPDDCTLASRMLCKLLENKPDMERACLIMFDEMKINSLATYDSTADKIMGPYDSMQQVMIRSVFGKWRLPFFFDFNRPITPELLDELVVMVEAGGGNVVAVVSDLGGSNRGLWAELNIDHEGQTFFPNPVDQSRNIWVFADTPHLLKLLRNHVLDDGVTLPNGAVVDKTLLTSVLAIDEGRDYKILPKLSIDTHLEVRGQARQKVRPAAQLLSRSTATAIELFLPERKNEAAFVRLCNDSFDVLNGKVPGDSNRLRRGLSVTSDDSFKVLSDLEACILTMKVGRRGALLPFQKGYLVTIRSMRGLVADVARLHGPSAYVLPGRVNQDILESFFSQVRGKGGANFNPSPSEAKCRVRNLTLMFCMRLKLNPVAKTTASADELTSDADELESPDAFKVTDFVTERGMEDEEAAADADDMQSLLLEAEHRHRSSAGANTSCSPIDYSTGVSAEGYAMAHAAGYVAAKCRRVDPTLGAPSAFAEEEAPVETMWTRLLSHGGLNIPTAIWMQKFKEMERSFCHHHHLEDDGLSRSPGVISTLVDQLSAQHPTLDPRVVRRFVRLRTFIRLGYINKGRRRAAREKRDNRKKKEFSS